MKNEQVREVLQGVYSFPEESLASEAARNITLLAYQNVVTLLAERASESIQCTLSPPQVYARAVSEVLRLMETTADEWDFDVACKPEDGDE